MYLCWIRRVSLLVGQVWAQVVIGHLQEGERGLPGITVWWEGTSIGTVTDTSGYFRIGFPPRWPALLRNSYVPDSLWLQGPPTDTLHWSLTRGLTLPTQQIEGQAPGISLSPQSPIALQTWSRQALTAAPCCNLSEAFEGTALVDAAISDGALGLRQLRLLGFEPAHSPLLYENKPLSAGLYRPWAAQFLPALWVQSLSVAKGIGSVLSGYDGPAGQIQVQYLPADAAPYPHTVELFARSTGEFLFSSRHQIEKNAWTLLGLTHLGWTPFQSAFLQDHNGDGFLDIPLYRHGHGLIKALRRDSSGDMVEIDAEGLVDSRWGGQVNFKTADQIARLEAWGTRTDTRMAQLSLRRGWVLPKGQGLSLLAQVRYLDEALQAGFNRYAAQQPWAWIQLIYRRPIRDTRLIWQGGITARAAYYAESLSTWQGYDTVWRRPEGIGGAFTELTWTPSPRLSAVVGGRIDWHSYWGWQAVPRLHLRWQYATAGAIRLSGGRSWRVPDPLAESFPFLLSNRQWTLSFPGWPAVEKAWSYGFFWQQSFPVGRHLLRLAVDGVRAHLQNPLLWDIERSWAIKVFSAQQAALYQTLYAEVTYEIPDQLRFQLSYKHQEVWWPLAGSYRFRPLLPKDRWVAWLSWMTLSRRWQVDGILSWIGPQRLPSTAEKPYPYNSLPPKTPPYAILTLQVTHRIDQWEIQAAVENLNNFRQARPVLAPEAPFSPYFDASLIWGPIMGRLASLTVRYSW
ncbi:MAG: TonB-dependent receptor [Bacteroidia bacterium]|nr:TonB-dependent receptor [Bacteroidia bacterium]